MMICGDRFPELLQRPSRGRMRSYITIQELARPDFHDDEDVEHPKTGRHRDQKITGENGSRVIPDERLPVLRRCSPASPIWLRSQ